MEKDRLSESVIFTTQAGAFAYGLNEIQRVGARVQKTEALGQGVGRVVLEGGFDRLAELFREKPPVFIRHICPASLCVPMTGPDMACLGDAVYAAFNRCLIKERTFSVQTVLLGDAEQIYKRFEVNQAVAERFVAMGGVLDIRKPEQILSIVLLPDRAYGGYSLAEQNMSIWAGGVRRFSREDEQINRAEFKLLEAIEVFSPRFPKDGIGLDLGAAPGGWTRVLRQQGLKVIAVDPADLHPRVQADPGVEHFRGTAQRYFENPRQVDLVVNDMRMDAHLSVKIMGVAADSLAPGGYGIMTLKLAQKNQQAHSAKSIRALEEWYQVLGARQLFHNRSEITVCLKKKGLNEG